MSVSGKAIVLLSGFLVSRLLPWDAEARSTTLSYNQAGQLLGESHSGGTLAGLSVTNKFDAYLRKTQVAARLDSSGALLSTNEFAYDAASRLATVTSGNNSATYGYLANSPLVASLLFKQGSTARLSTTNQFDYLDRPTSVSHSPQAQSFAYTYNSANQRTRTTWADNSSWNYAYDALGQVTSGKRLWSDGSHAAGQQFEYRFDGIGNRTRAASGGNEWGSNLRYAAYSSSQLNQITNRSVPGSVDITGSATNTATVTVWPSTGALPLATVRKGEYYRAEVPITNGSAAVWLTVTNLAVRNGYDESDLVTNFTGSLFVPKTPQAFLYDSDGNLTNDGRWTLSWDTENRLRHMGTETSVATNARAGLEFKYDYQGRRISKVVSNWVGSAWNKLYERKFLYDGMNLIAVLDDQSAILQSFHWGTDLSQSMGGAGGVGGLLAMTVHAGSNAGTYFYAYDGNGNVVALISASDGSVAAQYEYGLFGELLRATGSLAKENPFRFSTKYQDDETDLIYYGFRYYCASTGQWLNRDPLGEAGELNLYAFVANDPVNQVDVAGLWGVQFGAASPNIGVGQSTFTFDLDTYKQTVGSALDAAFGHDLGLHYDRCDPALASTRGLAMASGTALSIFGPLRAAQWAAAGSGLLRSGVGLGLSAFEVYQSAEAVSEGYQAIQQGNPWGFVQAGLGLWGVKAGVPVLASSARRLARSVEGALARRAAKTTLARLQGTFDELAEQRLLPQFRALDPNLKAGYTGSFKTGTVGNPTKATYGQPIDLYRFDIDYWIESDVLFQKFGPNLRANPEFRKILSETPGFEGLKPNKSGFSIKFKPSSGN